MNGSRTVFWTAVALAGFCSPGCQRSSTTASTPAGGNQSAGAAVPAPTSSTVPTVAQNGAASPAKVPASRTATADNPDAELISLIYYSLSGQTPPLEDWAKQDFQFVPNEFDRASKTAAALTAYKTKYAFASQVGHLTVPISSQLSDYDSKYGEFYVGAFSPSSSLSFPYKGETFTLDFDNGDQAQHWKLSSTDAAQVIGRNSGSHSVVISAALDILNAQPASNGGTLVVRITKFAVQGAGGNQPLGAVSVLSH